MNNIENLIKYVEDHSNNFLGSKATLKENETFEYMYDLLIETLEKQIPKKPEFYGDSEDGKLLCPSCNEDLWDVRECGYNGCPYCLQAIDWRNEDE